MKIFSEKLIVVGMLVLCTYLDAMQVKRSKPPVPPRPLHLRPSLSPPQVGQQKKLSGNSLAEKNQKMSVDRKAYQLFLKKNQTKNLEWLREKLARCTYDLETYELVCLDLYNDKQISGSLLACACTLLAWQISLTKRTPNNEVDIRDIIAYIYMRFERDDERISQYSKKRCHMLATFIFDVLFHKHWCVDAGALSEDGRSELRTFLYRRNDEPALIEDREYFDELPEMKPDEALQVLQPLVSGNRINARDITIERGQATAEDKMVIAFYRMCTRLAKLERLCSDREKKDLDAFKKEFAPGGKWPQGEKALEIQAQLKSIWEVIAIRETHIQGWEGELQRGMAALFSQLTRQAQQELKPSIFTPLAKFLRNRYLHYGCLSIAGIVVGVYGSWLYRKIFQKQALQLARIW